MLLPFVGDSVGGSHISALELVRGLDRRRYNAIVAIHQEGRLRNYVETQGIAAERAPAWTRDPFSGESCERTLSPYSLPTAPSDFISSAAVASISFTPKMRVCTSSGASQPKWLG